MAHYAVAGDFSNRFTVAAFDSRTERDRWLAWMADQDSYEAEAISRTQARRRLGRTYFDPGTEDMRDSIGCYLGCKGRFDDAEARDAATAIDVSRWTCRMEPNEDGLPEPVPFDFCDPPVRL